MRTYCVRGCSSAKDVLLLDNFQQAYSVCIKRGEDEFKFAEARSDFLYNITEVEGRSFKSARHDDAPRSSWQHGRRNQRTRVARADSRHRSLVLQATPCVPSPRTESCCPTPLWICTSCKIQCDGMHEVLNVHTVYNYGKCK